MFVLAKLLVQGQLGPAFVLGGEPEIGDRHVHSLLRQTGGLDSGGEAVSPARLAQAVERPKDKKMAVKTSNQHDIQYIGPF